MADIPEHDHLVNGFCQFCALLDPELHSRRQCQCSTDDLGQIFKCAWCRVKAFKAMNATPPDMWSTDVTRSTLPALDERL